MKRVLLYLLLTNTLFAQKMDYITFTEQVLANNPGILQLKSEIEMAQMEIKKAKASYLPTLSFTHSLTYITNPTEPVYLNISDLESFLPNLPGSTTSLDRIKLMDSPEPTWYDFKLELTQPIFTWGKISNGKKIYDSLAKVKFFEKRQLESELRSRVTILYYSITLIQEISKVLEKQAEIAQTLKKLSEENYNNGFIEYSTLLDIEYMVIDIERAQSDLLLQQETTFNQLRFLSGKEDLKIDQLDLNLNTNYQDYPFDINPENIELLISRNPTIKQLKEVLVIKEYEYNISKASTNFKPDFILKMDLNYNGFRYPFIEPDWYRQDTHGLNLTVALTTTLFDGGKSSNEKKIKKEASGLSYELYREAELSIKEHIYRSLYNLENLKLKLKNYSDRIELTSKKRELSDIKFNQGLILESELLSDDIELYQDNINYLSELLNFFIEYYTLESFKN